MARNIVIPVNKPKRGLKEEKMEIRIGVQQSTREIVLDMEDDAAKVAKLVADSIANGEILDLTDAKGRRVMVPVAKLAYVEFGIAAATRVGFN